MTKRFTLINWDNYAEGDYIYYDDGEEMGSLDVLDTLNSLSEENKQLKSDNNRLVNQTAKIVSEHQRKVLNLIDKKIDELERQYKFGQEVFKGCPMHNILHSINTLKELKKELKE